MIIAHACLEILDFRNSTFKFSDSELDFTKDLPVDYVRSIVEKIEKNSSKRVGTFNADSPIASLLKTYDSTNTNFVQFSHDISVLFSDALKKSGVLESKDLLTIEYRKDAGVYLAFVLLDNGEAITHEIFEGNSIQFTKNISILPQTSTKINTFMIVSIPDLNFYSCEKFREIDGIKHKVIEEEVVKATFLPSTNEIFTAVKQVASKLSDESGNDKNEIIANVKSYIENNSDKDTLDVSDLCDKVFDDKNVSNTMKDNLAKRGVTDVLPYEYHLTENKVKNAKIKCDNGVEIVVPNSYLQNNDNVEIRTNSDGTMTIEIKNITKFSAR
ncbi:MAG: nucleoid-associated protein [Acholeplasmatales bacterium]|nr:nucleoid-associated protein [Acholeplasmatales bacterium]